jgi:hypothetical protein
MINTENLSVVNQRLISKIDAIILDECKSYEISGTHTVLEHINGYIFAVCHTIVKNSTDMHRYNIFCFSDFGVTCLFKNGNFIDNNKYISMYEAIERTKNFFLHHSRKLSQINNL